MEVFTLCDCDNIINSYLAHYNQKQIAVAIRKKTHSVNEPLVNQCFSIEDDNDDICTTGRPPVDREDKTRDRIICPTITLEGIFKLVF